MKEKKEEEEDGWTSRSYSFAAYAGSCLLFLFYRNPILESDSLAAHLYEVQSDTMGH